MVCGSARLLASGLGLLGFLPWFVYIREQFLPLGLFVDEFCFQFSYFLVLFFNQNGLLLNFQAITFDTAFQSGDADLESDFSA